MKRDTIATGEALPKIAGPREARAVELRGAVEQFIRVCADAPGPRGGLRPLGMWLKVHSSKCLVRRALDRFCDASGVERL